MVNYISWGNDLLTRLTQHKNQNQHSEMSIENYLGVIDDHAVQTIIGEMRHDKKRSKLNASRSPKLTRDERITLMELLFENNICGLHISYWSRTWWLIKGGKFSQLFPNNAKLDEFERGERKAKTR